VAQLIVRNIEDELVLALKRRAARHGHSMEAEHRAILREALTRDERGQSFRAVLGSMPDGLADEDLGRQADLPRETDL
jgi:plasmid stability protein